MHVLYVSFDRSMWPVFYIAGVISKFSIIVETDLATGIAAIIAVTR